MLKKIRFYALYVPAAIFFIFNSYQAYGDLDVKLPFVKAEKKVLRLAHCLSKNSPYDKGARRFAELVEAYTQGELKVRIIPECKLGTEQEIAKMCYIGALDVALLAVNNTSMWYPPLDIYTMPFIFRDREHAEKVLFGPVGKEIEKNYLNVCNMRIISWFEWGDRAIFNNKRAIKSPENLVGIRIRVPKNSVMIDTYNALGATAIAINWGSLYSELQQNLVDGLEGPPQGMIDMKFYDFLHYYSYISVFYGLADVIINETVFQKLSKENQAAIIKAGREAGEYQRWLSKISHSKGLNELAKLGVKVNIIQDKRAFVQKVMPVWDKYRKKIGDKWFDAIINSR